MNAFQLALLSGLFHAAWNALAKTPGRERAATLAALIISGVGAAVYWALTRPGRLEVVHVPWIAMAGVGEALYVYSLGMAYGRGELGLTYSVSRAAALVFIWPFSLLAFGTRPSLLALAATVVVALGIVGTRPRTAGSSKLHLGWTLLTGAAVALYHTGYKGAVDGGAPRVLAFLGAVSISVPLLLAVVGHEVRAQLVPLARHPRLLAAGVLCAASFLLMLEALATAESGRILGVRNASVGFGLAIAVWLGERLDRRQWLGVAVLFAGVALFGLEQARG